MKRRGDLTIVVMKLVIPDRTRRGRNIYFDRHRVSGNYSGIGCIGGCEHIPESMVSQRLEISGHVNDSSACRHSHPSGRSGN